MRHGLPNALLVVLTVVGLQIGNLLGGAFIVETIFSWHGIGELAVNAIKWRDFTLTQAIILISALSYLLINLAVRASERSRGDLREGRSAAGAPGALSA